jgi:hypothetical protein
MNCTIVIASCCAIFSCSSALLLPTLYHILLRLDSHFILCHKEFPALASALHRLESIDKLVHDRSLQIAIPHASLFLMGLV